MDEDRGKAWPLADAVLVDKVISAGISNMQMRGICFKTPTDTILDS